MKINKILIVVSILIIVTVEGCTTGEKSPSNLSSEPRENSEGGILISVTYLPDITNSTPFDIKVTAHQNYNDDFQNNSFLRDINGKTYQPLSYEGTRGHHASGTIRFPKIESNRFELIIQNVGGIKERIFKW